MFKKFYTKLRHQVPGAEALKVKREAIGQIGASSSLFETQFDEFCLELCFFSKYLAC